MTRQTFLGRAAAPLIVASLLLAGCGGYSEHVAEHAAPADFHSTLQLAAERETVAVIDFYTDWCSWCKKFDEAVQSDPDLESKLSQVAFLKLNAEADEGVELAERYGVSGYPTFVVLNDRGEVVNRWAGYEDPEEFIGKLDTSIADPTTLEDKLARFEAEPTPELAVILGRIHDSGGESVKAIDYFRTAQELDPASADACATDLFWATYSAAHEDENFPFEDVRQTADAVMQSASAKLTDKMMTARLMAREAVKREDTALLAAYVEPMLEASAGVEDEDVVKARRHLEIAEALHLKRDEARAVALKRESMPEGWEDDPSDLNGFAWWCFENRVNLEEAEQLARKGVELAEAGQEKAMILDTVAELCHLKGDCREALQMIAAALEEDPDGEHYQEQQARFEEECAG